MLAAHVRRLEEIMCVRLGEGRWRQEWDRIGFVLENGSVYCLLQCATFKVSDELDCPPAAFLGFESEGDPLGI